MDIARILVVEDQAIVATALESLLVSFGYVVAATLADGGRYVGVAPSANLINVRVSDARAWKKRV